MKMKSWIYLLIGFCAGSLTGLGAGGGAILIPALDFLGQDQLDAQLLNLMYYVPVAVMTSSINLKNDLINKKVVYKLLFAAICGSIIGALISTNIDAKIIKKVFSVLLFSAGIYELFFHKSSGW